MTIVDVTVRIFTAEDVDVLDVGDLVDEQLTEIDSVLSTRIIKLWERFDPSSGFKRPGGRPPVQRVQAIRWLSEFLGVLGAVPASDVQAEAVRVGISVKTLRRAAHDLGVVRSPKSGPRCSWRLPANPKNRRSS